MLSFVLPYYLNPEMLRVQYGVWAGYPEALKRRIEVVVVDDGSPSFPAHEVERPEGLPALRIYRHTEDRPWHQHAARNLGAVHARGEWLLLTDMDHVVTAQALTALVSMKRVWRDEGRPFFYTFERVDAPDMTPTVRPDGTPKRHPNSFVMAKDLYWRIGGYDEAYCGVYGTDGLFRSRAFEIAEEVFLADVPLVRYSRDVVPDASTRTLARKEGREPGAKDAVRARKEAQGRAGMRDLLTVPWERML